MLSLSLNSIFHNKLKYDTRDPIFHYDLEGNKKIALLPPNLDFHLQLVALYLLQSILSLVLCMIVYKFIIQSRVSSFHSIKNPIILNSTRLREFFIGYGVIIPIAIILPFKIIDHLSIENIILRFSLVILPNAVVFRCLEAMYNCSPDVVETSLFNYCIYYSSVLEILFCHKTKSPKMVTKQEVFQRISTLLRNLITLSILFSVLHPHQFQYFQTKLPPDSMNHAWHELLHLNHICNNLIAAFLLFLVLSFGSDMLVIGLNLVTGYKTIIFMRDPLLSSTSPSDFWGKRWNMIIHSLLKRGVFRPVRKYYGRSVAMIVVFIVSGLMHEYVCSVIFYANPSKNEELDSHFSPVYGKNMIFFVWNGIIMFLEHQIGHWYIFQWMKQNLPAPIRTFLVIMTAIPVSHLFTGDWIVGGYFQDFVHAIPMFVLRDKNEVI